MWFDSDGLECHVQTDTQKKAFLRFMHLHFNTNMETVNTIHILSYIFYVSHRSVFVDFRFQQNWTNEKYNEIFIIRIPIICDTL